MWYSPGSGYREVRVFQTFTADREALADWLLERGITTVAKESTGCIDSAISDPEDRGLRPCLVNARHTCNVPGGARTGKNASGSSIYIPAD